MRKITCILLLLLTPLFLYSFEMKDFIAKPRNKGKTLCYSVSTTTDGKTTNYQMTVKFDNTQEGMVMSVLRDGKVLAEILLDNELKPVKERIPSENKWVEIKVENPEQKYTKISEKSTTVEVNGKTYNAIETEYSRTGENRIEKNNLFMVTTVSTTKKVWKDPETGVLIKEVIEKDIVQKTFHKLKPEEAINVRKSRVEERIELMEGF